MLCVFFLTQVCVGTRQNICILEKTFGGSRPKWGCLSEIIFPQNIDLVLTLSGEKMLHYLSHTQIVWGSIRKKWRKQKWFTHSFCSVFVACLYLCLCLALLFLAPITPTPLQGFLKTISCLSNKNNSFSPLLPSLPIPSSRSLSPSLIPCSLWHPCHERDEERERQISPLSWNDPVKCQRFSHTLQAFDFLQFDDVSHSQIH